MVEFYIIQTPKGHLHVDQEGQYYLGGDVSVTLALFDSEANAKRQIDIASIQLKERMGGNAPRSFTLAKARRLD
jgi:hypothetical protein